MRERDLQYLACPGCHAGLALDPGADRDGPLVETGQLRCVACAAGYSIVRGVPRFVPNENYASSFGLQWTRHAQTQYESHRSESLLLKRMLSRRDDHRGAYSSR